MYIDVQTIILAGSCLTALLLLGGTYNKIHKWYLRQGQQDTDIKGLKAEQNVITSGVLACLKGLKERGCNGPVTKAIEDIENYINQKAHE